MNFAIGRKVLGSMPAMFTFAALNASRPGHVTTPVTTLIRLHLFAYCDLKVFITNLSVLICIKVVKKLREFLF